MMKLSYAELQTINAGIVLSIPDPNIKENKFLTRAKDTEQKTHSDPKEPGEKKRRPGLRQSG